MQYYRDLEEGVIRSSNRISIRSFYVETSTVNAVEVARNHFNSWNRHDADAIVGAFVEGGTYNNPNVDQPLTGAAIGDFAKSVFAAFPDMSLEIITIGDTGGGLVALQWVLRGTNTGRLGASAPATGRRVTLPGASFVQVEGIKSVPSAPITTGKLWMSSWSLSFDGLMERQIRLHSTLGSQ